MLLDDHEDWRLHEGDCIPHMLAEMPAESIDMSVFSPPFPSLYAYTDSHADVGNVATMDMEAKVHLSFVFAGLRRVLKPGRVAVVHVQNFARMRRTGGEGLCDFRGICIRLGERAGLIYEYDWIVRKNPQAQAIRTKSRNLQFAGLEADRANSRGALGDYLLKFRAPGQNAVPIDTPDEVSRNDWIEWAEACWSDVIETDTLNVAEGRDEEDVKHICPLQLEVIRRCVLLYSNPGETVFSPFTGIGSEGFVSLGGTSPKTRKRIANPRRFYGCELKPSYAEAARRNMERAVASRADVRKQKALFATGGAE